VCIGELPLDFVVAGTWVSGHSGEATPTVEVGMQMQAFEGAVKTMNADSMARPSSLCPGVASIWWYNGGGGLLLFECLLHHAQPCALCEWTALWDKVEPILRDGRSAVRSAVKAGCATCH